MKTAPEEARADCPNCGRPGQLNPPDAAGIAVCRCCGGWTFVHKYSQSQIEIYSEAYFQGAEYSAYDASEAVYRKNFRRKIRLLRDLGVLTDPATPIFELGCASGFFLDCLREEGFGNLLAAEISPHARALARARGHEIISPEAPEFLDRLRAFRPGLLCGWDVWEHLPSPADLVRTLLACGETGCTLALSTLAADAWLPRLRGTRWRQFHPPTHLNYPTRLSLKLFAAEQGLTPEYQKSWGSFRPAADYLLALGKPLRRLVTLPSFYRIPIYLNTGDTQLFVARGFAFARSPKG